MGAADSKTNPERAYGQAHSRGGEANTTTEIDTGLALVRPYDPYCLWLSNCSFDRSVFHEGDGDGEEEKPRMVRFPVRFAVNTTV